MKCEMLWFFKFFFKLFKKENEFRSNLWDFVYFFN